MGALSCGWIVAQQAIICFLNTKALPVRGSTRQLRPRTGTILASELQRPDREELLRPEPTKLWS
jgi:hypothetical protein